MARSRTRRVLKWIGTVLCVLILGVWVWSGWYWVRIGPTNMFKQAWISGESIPNNYERVVLARGIISAMWVRPSERREFAIYLEKRDEHPEIPPVWVEGFPDPPEFAWCLPSIDDDTASWQLELLVPLWIPFLLAAIPTTLLWWADRDRRIRPGQCQKCGYDLTGNVSGRCPECGEPVEAKDKTG